MKATASASRPSRTMCFLIFSATAISDDLADLRRDKGDAEDEDDEQSVSEDRKWEATTSSGTLGPSILLQGSGIIISYDDVFCVRNIHGRELTLN